MIIGLTHEESGVPIKRLAVGLKVSIGLPPQPGKNYPQKLDHFYFTSKDAKGEWVKDELITAIIQERYNTLHSPHGGSAEVPIRRFDIVFLSDDIDDVFRTEYAWWSVHERKCSGNGREATRKVSALTPEQKKDLPKDAVEVPWTPCGPTCPDLQAKRCKPSGALYFLLADKPVIGSVCAYYSTSYQTIRQIFSSLVEIQELTETVTGSPRLKGIRLQMVLRPGKTHYEDKDGNKKSSNAFFVSIEFSPKDPGNLLPELVSQSLLYDRVSRDAKLIGSGSTKIVDLDEPDKAIVMSGEFFPENADDDPPEPTKTDAPPVSLGSGIDVLGPALGLNKSKRDAIMSACGGEVEAAVKFMEKLQSYAKELGAGAKEVDEWVTRGLQKQDWLWKSLNTLVETKKAKEKAATENPLPPVAPKTKETKSKTKSSPTPAPTAPPVQAAQPPPQAKPPEAAQPALPGAGEDSQWGF